MNTRKWLTVNGIVVLVMLALAVGLTQAQGPKPPEGESRPQSEAAAAAVGSVIPIQGRLTDDSGNPINGTRTITFTLYDQSSGGAILCQDDDDVEIANGLFNANMSFCTSSDIDGRALYLGIQVEGDDEIADRQPIYPIPYAWSLRPGAVISTSGYPALHVESTNPSGRGLRAYATATSGTNYGVVGASKSPDGYGGYFYNTDSGVGVYGQSDTGAAIRAAGTGVIQSTADTDIAVSPLNMIADWESAGDVELLSDGVYMEVRPSTSGFQYVHIPVTLPSVLFGTSTKFKSVRICYRCDQTASFVSTTIVGQGTDSGTLNNIVNDTTDRTSTDWECYTVTADTPETITGSVYIQLTFDFDGTGSAHDIRIGNITLTLTEQ